MGMVDDAGGQEVADDRGASPDAHVLTVRRLARRLERLGGGSIEEMERGASLHLDRGAHVMHEHKDRRVEWRIWAPPALPFEILVPPRIAILSGAHDLGADARIVLADEGIVDPRGTSRPAAPFLVRKSVVSVASLMPMTTTSGRSRLVGLSEATIASISACGAAGAIAVAERRQKMQPPKPYYSQNDKSHPAPDQDEFRHEQLAPIAARVAPVPLSAIEHPNDVRFWQK